MIFAVFGISHKTATLKIREKYSLSKKQISDLSTKIITNNLVNGVVILSTCNRMEVYVSTNFRGIRDFLFNKLQIMSCDLQYFYFLRDYEAVKHIFRVSSGLDSQVIGESQILGQIKNAYLYAKELKVIDKYISLMFEKAIEVGRIVRVKTDISKGNISIGTVAVKLAENLLGDLNNKKILIIGTGEIAQLVSKYLMGKKISKLFVANRTYEKAVELANLTGGKAIKFDTLKDELKDADILISATASPHLIFKRDDIMEVMAQRSMLNIKQPLVMIDLALPCDIDPEIKNLTNVLLYNLDDLKQIIDENYKKRIKEAKKAEKIIEEELNSFWRWIIKEELELVHAQVV